MIRVIGGWIGGVERAAGWAFLIALVGCGAATAPIPAADVDDDDDDDATTTVTVTFKDYCATKTNLYFTQHGTDACKAETSNGPIELSVGDAHSFSGSTKSATENPCDTGTRVEFTPGANGDVSFDISTNAGYPPQPVPFFEMAVQILAMQATATTPCALPVWNGGEAADDLRGVSTQECKVATCPTAYQTPTSGPAFITRNTAAYEYIVEWCPSKNPTPVPTCVPPEPSNGAPCPNLCYIDAIQSALVCSADDIGGAHVMCNADPFGGTPPESYCLLTTDCVSPRKSCGCCWTDSDCSGGDACTDFRCQ